MEKENATVYISFDGRKFLTEKACADYEEKLKRGIDLQENIEDYKKKIEAAKTSLDFSGGVKHVSIKIHFNGYPPYDLDMIMKPSLIKIFKQYYEKLLKEAETEFDNL